MGTETKKANTLLKKIAVITINYNNAHGLENTIKSVLGQTSSNFEFIIVDGGSTDESVTVIQRFADKLTTWISEKDNGIYHAQNKGIALTGAEYCLFLNSGDVLAGEKVLESVSCHLDETGILYGDIISVNKSGVREYLRSPDKVDVYHMMISTLWHPCAFIKRSIFDTFGGYDEEFRITGDYEFFVRVILKHNIESRHINQAIAVFDLGGISNSPDMSKRQEEERKKSWELNFSDPVIEVFEKKTRMLRSREYKLGRWVMKFLKPFSAGK